MKKILLIGIAFISSQVIFAQKKYAGLFELQGNLTKYSVGKPSTLMIDYLSLDGKRKFDSVPIIDGKFFISKQLTEPLLILMAINFPQQAGARGMRQDGFSLFAVPSKNYLYTNTLLNKAVLTGGTVKANTEYSLLEREIIPAKIKFNQLVQDIRNTDTGNIQLRKKTIGLRDSISDFIDAQFYKSYAITHPLSPVATYALMRYANNPVWTPRKKMQPELVENLLSKIDRSLLDMPTIKALKNELQISKATGVGRDVLDFTLNDTLGNPVKLSDYKGKYVFLDFWASWCVPCRKENPNVVNMFNKYKDKGFTVLSVSLDKPEQKQAWLAAIKKDGLTAWAHVSDLKGFESDAAKKYYVQSIPTNFLIGPDGKFIGRNLYGEALEKKLSELIN